MNIKQYFERVVLINLKRRPDRLARVQQELNRCQWPFKLPEIIEAVDGYASPPLPSWSFGPGAWGCMKSHQFVLESAITDGVESLLVLEDDVCFVDDFADRIKKFLSIVPDDWDQLMIGGQHFNSYGEPQLVRPGIVQCADCQRLHCHAVRGTYMHLLLNRWRGGGLYNGLEHCDCIMGRDPELQLANKVYAPQMFLAGQENGQSDILGKPMPRKFWNPPDRNLMVVCLRAPDDVITAMEQFGFCVGRGCGRDGRLDLKLAAIFDTTRTSATARINQLRNWINLMQWELAADPQFVCTVAHPEATPAIVEAASLWQVRTIQADNLTDALAQAPQKLKKARPIPLLNKVKA